MIRPGFALILGSPLALVEGGSAGRPDPPAHSGPGGLLIPLAHGIGQSTDLPLPLDLVLQAGAATVVVSFLASALLWRRPRLTHPTERHPRSTWWRRPLRQGRIYPR